MPLFERQLTPSSLNALVSTTQAGRVHSCQLTATPFCPPCYRSARSKVLPSAPQMPLALGVTFPSSRLSAPSSILGPSTSHSALSTPFFSPCKSRRSLGITERICLPNNICTPSAFALQHTDPLHCSAQACANFQCSPVGSFSFLASFAVCWLPYQGALASRAL